MRAPPLDLCVVVSARHALTLDDLNEAVTTLEDLERIARRVLGGAHPVTGGIGGDLIKARGTLLDRETPSPGCA